MNNELLERLAAAARRETPPAVEVADRVLRTIAAPPPRTERVFLWMACGSAAAAAAATAVLYALPAWEAWVDPLAQIMIAMQGVAP